VRRTAFLLLALTLGHVLLISAQVQSGSGIPVVQTVAFGAFAKVQQVLASFADGGRSIWSNYFALRGVVRDNDQLKRRILQLESALQDAQAKARDTEALRRALGLRESLTARTLTARVIAGAPSPGSFSVTIDRGVDDGVETDMAVIGANGVVGRVINRPLPHAAQVQLLIDRNAHAAVYFERTGVGGIVGGGRGEPPLHVDYVPDSADVRPGDTVLTSGQDGIYPRGYLVGTVVEFVRHGGDPVVTVRPAVDFSHVDIVMVVLDRIPVPAPIESGAEGGRR
jgi:rod shape-determining protein MreC